MEHFRSEGGDNRPYFKYRIKVPKFTGVMYEWCLDYDDQGCHFRRFHIEWKESYQKKYDVV